MKFEDLSSYLEKLEKTASRIEITKILSDLFKNSGEDEIDKVVYLSLGVLAPNYEGRILNLAEKMMIRILARAFDKSPEEVKTLYKKSGDLGNTAQALGDSGRKALSVTKIYEKLFEIAKDNGGGSQERKVGLMAKLLGDLDSLSARYVARIPVGRLRLGFSEKTILDALSLAFSIDKKEVEDAYNIRPDIGYVAKLVKQGRLEKAKPEVGVPVVPMLAQRLNSTVEIVKKMGEVSVEPKFDGLRIFIHYRRKDGFLRVFTRNMNVISINTFPELRDVGEYIKSWEVILDTEAVGIDPKREMFLDFQKTIQRRRKHDIERSSSNIPLQFQVFDILLVNGKSLLNAPYIERRKEVEKAIVDGSVLRVDENTITSSPAVIKNLHQKYLKMGLEGIIAKKANGLYVSGRTGWNWVKMKEEEGQKGKLSDTVDCIVMGYSLGKGKRARFGLGKILVGIKDGDRVRTLTKVGTGLTEEKLVEMKNRIDKLQSKLKPKEYEVDKELTPDVWAMPSFVVEVAADSISKSPRHSLGLSLRFPKFIGFRDDKNPDQATTLRELEDLFKMQNI